MHLIHDVNLPWANIHILSEYIIPSNRTLQCRKIDLLHCVFTFFVARYNPIIAEPGNEDDPDWHCDAGRWWHGTTCRPDCLHQVFAACQPAHGWL